MTALAPTATLARRRFQLTARTPRELFVPLLTPIMFALVIAPALKQALHTDASYESFVAIGTAGLLIPLNTMFAGLGVIVDREDGARRELLAAPVPRALLVLGNLAVAVAVTILQVATLIVAALARGIDFHTRTSGVTKSNSYHGRTRMKSTYSCAVRAARRSSAVGVSERSISVTRPKSVS